MPLPSGIVLPNRASNHVHAAASSESLRRRNRLLCHVFLYAALMLSGYQAMWTYWLAGVNIPDYEIDKETGQKRIRRRPELLTKHDHITGKDVPTSPLDGILEGYLTLVNIYIPSSGLVSTPSQKYKNVKAQFCHIAWLHQQLDPSKVPMFRDLKQESVLCPSTTYNVDLWDMTRQARDYDRRNHTFSATNPKEGQGPVPPTAVVFHETRCGSTLIGNLMAAFRPLNTRVYSEAPAPLVALQACESWKNGGGNVRCDEGAQDALIQDVFYMMGRITRPERPQFAFYKIQSVGTHSIHAFTRAMPQTPWLFAYRDSVEIMMSHFKNYQMGNPLSQDFMPVCLRNYGLSQQNPVLVDLVQAHGGAQVEDLSKEEYCAAHLASLAEAAVREHESLVATASTTPRWFVNYNELPSRIWDTVLPKVAPPVDAEMIERMQEMGTAYSKGRGSKAGKEWKDDSGLKQSKAPEVVKQAAAKFLDPLFKKMEDIRKKGLF